MITWLADAQGASAAAPLAGPDHPMRKITRAVADGGGWDRERAAKVGALFDSMAADWSAEHSSPERTASVVDAVERGDVGLDGKWLEIGSGTGAGSEVLQPKLDTNGGSLVCIDLSMEMLRHAAGDVPRVRGDAAVMPFADRSFDGVLMINMILFPDEVVRVLRPAGTVLWINSLGDQTPIHLPPDGVRAALERASNSVWSGTAANAGTGFWCVLGRAS